MAWLRKIWRLPAPDRFLLLQAIGLLAAIRVGLWLLPLGALRRLLRRATERRTTSGSGEPSKRRIAWAIASAQRLVPRATCLPQALAAQVLLARSGYAADLRIGVTKTWRVNWKPMRGWRVRGRSWSVA